MQYSSSNGNSYFGDWEEDPDDFAYANLDDDFEIWDEEVDIPTEVPVCRSPQDHRFERKLLLNSYYRECLICGYSPELDGSHTKFSDCHKSFQFWEGRLKI